MRHWSRSNIFNTGLWYHNLLKTKFTHANSCINMQKQTKCKKQSKKQMRLRLLWHSPRYSWWLLAKSKQWYICRDAEENWQKKNVCTKIHFHRASSLIFLLLSLLLLPLLVLMRFLFFHCLSVYKFSLYNHRKLWMYTAGAAVGSLMQLPINNQCPPPPPTPPLPRENFIKPASQLRPVSYHALHYLSTNQRSSLKAGWGSRGG